MFLAGSLVARRHVDNAVGVDVEGDLDLRNAARRRRYPDEGELPEELVGVGHLALALVHLDLDLGLPVGGRREDLALLRRDGRVAADQPGEDAAERLDAEREGRDVEEEHVGDVAGEHSPLDGRPDGHRLVRVDGAARLLAEHLLDGRLHLRHAAHATNEQDFANVGLADLGI